MIVSRYEKTGTIYESISEKQKRLKKEGLQKKDPENNPSDIVNTLMNPVSMVYSLINQNYVDSFLYIMFPIPTF